MKKLVMLVICALSVAFANAQSRIHWGIELGLGVSTWMGDGSDGADAMFNPNVGVKLDIPLNGLISFQTGLAWNSKGVKDKRDGLKGKVNQNYLEMPLLAAFHIGTGKNFDVVISGGGYLACGIKGKTSVEVDDVTVSWPTFKDASVDEIPVWHGLRRFDAGIRAGVGVDISHFQVGLNGEFGLCRVKKDGPRNLGICVSLGYMF